MKIKKQKKKSLINTGFFFSNQKKHLIQVIVVFSSTNTIDLVFWSFGIFESIKNWTNPCYKFVFLLQCFCFFCVFIFFVNRKVRGFSCEKMLLNWTWLVSIPEYLFHGKSEKKWRKTFLYIHTLFSMKGFFLLCKEKKILRKNHRWLVDAVFQ